MSLNQSNGVCPALLIGANEALRDIQGKIFEPIGFVQSLLDPTNRTTQIQVDQGNGHRKQVRLMHKQRILPTSIRDEKSCDSGEEKPRFEEIVDVNMFDELPIKVSESTIKLLCSAYSELVTIAGGENNINSFLSSSAASKAAAPLAIVREIYEEIALDINVLVNKMNAKLITAAVTKVGAWKGGDASKNFTVLKADGSPYLLGVSQMRQELRKAGMGNMMPIVVGGGNIELSYMGLEYGCCNDSGTDFGKMAPNAGANFYRDYVIEGEDGFDTANQFLAYMPGTMQLITYNAYKGNFGKIGTMDRGVIPIPTLPGVMADMRFLPNECGEYYDLFVSLNYDLYAAPQNLFAATDPLEDVNGIFKAVAISL